MSDPRTSPLFVSDERTMLTQWLDWHRETLAVKCAGLDEAGLRERSVPPSQMSLLGLVRHLAHVEFVWFQRHLMGEDTPNPVKSPEEPDGDFLNADTAPVGEAFALWRAGVDRARQVSAALPLDAVSRTPWRGNTVSHRWVLVHMIEEYARHNGHADLLRERVDGVTGS